MTAIEKPTPRTSGRRLRTDLSRRATAWPTAAAGDGATVGVRGDGRCERLVRADGAALGQGAGRRRHLDRRRRAESSGPVTTAPAAWQFLDSGGGWYRLRSRHSGKVLDVANASTADGAKVRQWADLNGTNQQFRLADCPPTATCG